MNLHNTTEEKIEYELDTKQCAEVALYMYEAYRKEFYASGKHHISVPQFHHWLQQLSEGSNHD